MKLLLPRLFLRHWLFTGSRIPKGNVCWSSKEKALRPSGKSSRNPGRALTIPEHMEHYLSQGMDKKTAMKQVAKDRGVGKRDIYQALL